MHLIPAFALVLLTAAPSLAQAPVRAAVKSDGLVYLSGVVAAGPDVTMQTAAAIEKIAATLKAEGSTLANVANVSVVLKSATDMPGSTRCSRSTGRRIRPPARRSSSTSR